MLVRAFVLLSALLLSSGVKAEWISTGELLLNPNFTGNSLSNWTTTGNPSFYSGTIEGVNYPSVYGRQSSYTVRQTLDLTSNGKGINEGLIDAGLVRYDASTWQMGWSGDADRGRLILYFYDAAGALLTSMTQGYKDPSTWTKTELSGYLPSLTRRVLFSLEGVRSSGTNNDAYFAKNSMELSSEIDQINLFGGYFIQGQPIVSDVPLQGMGFLAALGLLGLFRRKSV